MNPKVFLLALVVALVSLGGWAGGLATGLTQTVTLAVFAGVISTTLFFWERRVAAAFLGVAILIATHAMTLQSILRATELDIIFFLVGMMIIVGVLKDLGMRHAEAAAASVRSDRGHGDEHRLVGDDAWQPGRHIHREQGGADVCAVSGRRDAGGSGVAVRNTGDYRILVQA